MNYEELEEYAMSIGFVYSHVDPDCIAYYKLGSVKMCFTPYKHIGCVMNRFDYKGRRIRCYTKDDIDNALIELSYDN